VASFFLDTIKAQLRWILAVSINFVQTRLEVTPDYTLCLNGSNLNLECIEEFLRL